MRRCTVGTIICKEEHTCLPAFGIVSSHRPRVSEYKRHREKKDQGRGMRIAIFAVLAE
jgi:hypothetical protein